MTRNYRLRRSEDASRKSVLLVIVIRFGLLLLAVGLIANISGYVLAFAIFWERAFC